MNYSTNYDLNIPERNEQFNLDDWNANIEKIDNRMYINQVGIANNLNSINSLLNNLTTKDKIADTSSVFHKLMLLVYPVGSLYWSSKSANPSELFGGTWVQIKDKFVLACGDTYNLNVTSGSATVTLSIENLPSHNHSIAHSHTFTGTSGRVSKMSDDTVNGGSSHYYGNVQFQTQNGKDPMGLKFQSINGAFSAYGVAQQMYAVEGTSARWSQFPGFQINVNHSHNFTPSGTISSINSSTKSGSVGSTKSFSILPPYIVKYCWERTN